MELKQLIALLQKWLWLLIVGFVLGAGGGILFSIIQSPVYEATTKVLITRAPQQTSGVQSVLDNSLITQTYMQLLTMQPVLDETSEKVGFEVDPAVIQVSGITNTQIVQIKVADQDPARSALIANTLVETASQRYIDIQSEQYVAAEDNIQAQIDHVEGQITNLLVQIDQTSTSNLEAQILDVQAQMLPLQEEVNKLQQEIASLSPGYTADQRTKMAEDQARIDEITPLLSLYQQLYSNLVVLKTPISSNASGSDQLTTLQATLTLYNQIYANLVSNLETIRLAKLNNTSNAVQIEPASVPELPVRPNPTLYTALAAFCGLILAGGTLLLIEYLDDTIKTPEEVKKLLNLPVVGFITEMKKYGRSKGKNFIDQVSDTPPNEAFRSLKTNLEFVGMGKQVKTVLVTSSEQAEGKTTIAANLAITIAQEGKRVLLLDADMRQPSLHQLFGITNHTGLSDILNNELDANTAGYSWKKLKFLRVIPSGKLLPNSIELLGSEKTDQLLAKMKQSFDTIIIDTPPCFVADAQVLADKVDAVMLVVQPRHTHRDSIIAALEQLNRAGAKVVGVVMNRMPRSSVGDHYDNYHFYSRKLKTAPNGKRISPRKKKVTTFFNKIRSNGHAKQKVMEKDNSPDTISVREK